jgi:hypothetical protein
MKPEIGIGNVTVKLVGADSIERDLVLKPSLHAVRLLSRKYGGLQPLVDRIAKIDFDVIVDVLEAGAQVSANPKARAELEAAVYSAGLSDFAAGIPALCIKYITVLINGGRPPPDDPEGAASEGNPKPA